MPGLVRVGGERDEAESLPGAPTSRTWIVNRRFVLQPPAIANHLLGRRHIVEKLEIQLILKQRCPWIRPGAAQYNEVVVGAEIFQLETTRRLDRNLLPFPEHTPPHAHRD